MSATSETAAIFLGVTWVAPWVLIANGRLRSYHPRTPSAPKTTTGAVQADPVPAPVGQPDGPAILARIHTLDLPPAKPDTSAAPAALTAVDGKPRSKRLPPLKPLTEMNNPKLAEFARGRERDEHGHFKPTRSAS